MAFKMDPNQDRAVQAAFDGYVPAAELAGVLAAEKLIEAARALWKQLGGPSDAFTVSVHGQYILVTGYMDDLSQLDIPEEFRGYQVAWAPLDEAMGT